MSNITIISACQLDIGRRCAAGSELFEEVSFSLPIHPLSPQLHGVFLTRRNCQLYAIGCQPAVISFPAEVFKINIFCFFLAMQLFLKAFEADLS